MGFFSLAQRHCQPEIMDQPGLESARHMQALRGLARINRISASDSILWRPLRALVRSEPERAIRVLDIATGGGDVPIRLWQRAHRAGLTLEVHGADASATAIEHARANARRAGASVEFATLDVLREPLPDGFDVLTASLFLHHLGETQAVDLLRRMGQAARRLVLINDLVRSRLGYVAAWLGTRILSRSPIVHVDGPRSVEAAFTIAEAKQLAESAGLAHATVVRRWPWRFLMTWERLASS